MTEEQIDEKSYIYVEFEALGSAQFSMASERVTPLQMLGLASFLELQAKNMILAEQARQEHMQTQQPKIAVPNGAIIRPK
jgi:hypothetical protein